MEMDKERIRRMVYKALVDEGVAKPPYPIEGRIPNFKGAEAAAERLLTIKGFQDAETVKVNPDSPQRPVRRLALSMGKKLVMPSPRLKSGFLLLEGDRISNIDYASTIRGAFHLGRLLHPEELPHIDFIVEGSVAVGRDGSRLGKGEGYAEIEYAILLEYGKVDYRVEIASTVHDLQVFESLPRDPYDVSLTYIATPSRLVKCSDFFRPKGVIWELLDEEKIMEIPLLKELWSNR